MNAHNPRPIAKRRLATPLLAGCVIGALGALLLGLSMLAASETEKRAEATMEPYRLLFEAQLRGLQHGPLARIPCEPMQQAAKVGSDYMTLHVVTLAETVRQACCLYRRGLMSRADLASIIDTQPTRLRHGLSRVVPLSLQVVPSALLVTLWSILLAIEIVGVLILARHVRRR